MAEGVAAEGAAEGGDGGQKGGRGGGSAEAEGAQRCGRVGRGAVRACSGSRALVGRQLSCPLNVSIRWAV